VVIADRDVAAGKKLEQELTGYSDTEEAIYFRPLTLSGRNSSSATHPAGTTKSVCSKPPPHFPRPEKSPSSSQMPVSTEKMKSLPMLVTTVRSTS